jgi:hypothetical protein
MEALLGFRTSSSTHENGFVAAANCFVCLTGRRAAGAGEPCDSGDRPALDSPQKPDSPAAFLDSGRGHAGSAVRLKDHVDPCRNEQGDCRKPDQARDDIAPAPAQFPPPIRHLHSSAPSMQRWRALRRGTVTCGFNAVSIHQDYCRTSMAGSGAWAW